MARAAGVAVVAWLRWELMRSNSALVTDVYARRYRAFFNAAQRGR